MDDSHTPTAHAPRGTFAGIAVQEGPGGGLASASTLVSATSTHYHAARLPELGDTVLAVARHFDTTTAAALAIELRAFAAAAPGRGALAEMDEQTMLDSPGAIAYAKLELSELGFAADERRPARLLRCVVSDAAPTAAAARGVADWLRLTWETELAFGSWPALRGSLEAFAINGGAPADWAVDWLVQSEHHVTDADPGTFLKVLSDAWLEPLAAS
ncbi:MAG: hypothetical protein ABI200_04225, partial [Gaiellales bacterium]